MIGRLLALILVTLVAIVMFNQLINLLFEPMGAINIKIVLFVAVVFWTLGAIFHDK